MLDQDALSRGFCLRLHVSRVARARVLSQQFQTKPVSDDRAGVEESDSASRASGRQRGGGARLPMAQFVFTSEVEDSRGSEQGEESAYSCEASLRRVSAETWADFRRIRKMRLVRKLKTLVGGGPRFVPYDKPVDWQRPYETLRTKWIEVPITNWEILSSARLLALPDDELLAKWEKSRKEI